MHKWLDQGNSGCIGHAEVELYESSEAAVCWSSYGRRTGRDYEQMKSDMREAEPWEGGNSRRDFRTQVMHEARIATGALSSRVLCPRGDDDT